MLIYPEEEAIEEDSGATVLLNGASSGGADGFTSQRIVDCSALMYGGRLKIR